MSTHTLIKCDRCHVNLKLDGGLMPPQQKTVEIGPAILCEACAELLTAEELAQFIADNNLGA